MRKLKDEGGNSWFMGCLVTEYWIDDETGASEVKLANGKKYRKDTADPRGKYYEIEAETEATRESDRPF